MENIQSSISYKKKKVASAKRNGKMKLFLCKINFARFLYATWVE